MLDSNCNIKLIDFGDAKMLDHEAVAGQSKLGDK